jgi:opacity protein-like surface antigen
MKILNNILVSLVISANLLYGGGDFVQEPIYEIEDVSIAEETVIEEYPQSTITENYSKGVEEYSNPVEEYVSEPSVIKEKIVEEVPTVATNSTKKSIPKSAPPPSSSSLKKDIQTNGLYAGIGISRAKFKTNCKSSCVKSEIDKTGGFMARVGYDVNQYIGIEARGVRTNWKSDGGKVKHIGIFVKPMVPVGESTNIYGLAGVGKTTTQGRLQRVDTSSFAWGAGVEYDISGDKAKEGRYSREFDGHGDQEKGLGIFADYERLVQKSGSPDLDTLNIGVTYDF